MIEIEVNGERRQYAEKTNLAQLVTALGLQGKRVAVEVNLEIVPRSQYTQRLLVAGDRIEVVHAIGGG